MYQHNNEYFILGGGGYCQLHDFDKIDVSVCSDCDNFIPYPDIQILK